MPHKVEFIKSSERLQSWLKQIFAISNEFYYFLIFLILFNMYIYCTLQYNDPVLSQLNDETIQQMSPIAFEETISRLSPHFIELERNCKNKQLNHATSSEFWGYIKNIVWVNCTYRLIYLFVFYQCALYFETKYNTKQIKPNHNGMVVVHKRNKNKSLNLYKYIIIRLIGCTINTLLLLFFNFMDNISFLLKYNINFNKTDILMSNGLIDYSNVSVYNQIIDILIYIRVHPTGSLMIRISHGISYPFSLYALSRPNISQFVCCYMLSILSGVIFIGAFAHILDNKDLQLNCVRDSFILSTTVSSIHTEIIREMIAPYLNLVCLTIDCRKYLF
eukprot:199341_1